MSRGTHAVFNQSTPFVDINLFTANRALADALRFNHAGFDAARFAKLGAEMGGWPTPRSATAKPRPLRPPHRPGRVPPQLPRAAGAALRHRPARCAVVGGGRAAHVERAAAFMLFTEAEPSVLCPVSMSYAVTPALRANAAIYADWGAGLASTAYDPRFLPFTDKTGLTMGMGMTEKQGGSDVRANTTQAELRRRRRLGRALPHHRPQVVLLGADVRRLPGAGADPGGLSCFFLPRMLPDGTVNAIAIQRLKHKLGNHANASSEVEFDAACAWLVGDEGRGVPQILAMGALTRLDCALGTAGLMRQALSLALHHTAQRQAFGKR
jgi:putative acyl-CoA dehydrogenase